MEHSITFYSTKTCPSCKAAKAYVESKGFIYTNKDAGEDPKAREEMMEKSGGLLTTPIIDIDGKIIVGFKKDQIDEALK